MTKKLKGRVSAKDVDRLLSETDTYTLHKPVRLRFPRRKFITNGPGFLWQADLIDMTSFSKSNKGYKWILCVIDAFSRKLYALPTKDKSGKVITETFSKLLGQSDSQPSYLNTDRGKEFYNKHFKELMSENQIIHYSTNNQEKKAALIERAIRTLKQQIYRYFTHSNRYEYVEVLQDLIASYNNTTHSSLKISPNEVSSENLEEIWQDMYIPDEPPSSVATYKPGDRVRVSKYASTFKKGYLPLWSEEIFTIKDVRFTIPPTYSVIDDAGEVIDGTFYKQELQRVRVRDETYRVEKILSARKINGKTQYLVRWHGYPPSFDSYVDKRDLVTDYKN